MSDTEKNELHKEFELERMILFSDAVFAIAITLLIIEIKFPELPENYRQSLDLFKMFQPTIRDFAGFFLSFFFIGVTWARHLKIFRYLKSYDNGLIMRNLLGLAFIVAFPFSASGILHSKPSFMFPMLIYIGNIMFVMVTNFMLVSYIFHKKKNHLTIPGHEEEKRYIYMQAKMTAILFIAVFVIVTVTAIITRYDSMYISYSMYSLIFGGLIMRRRLKKYKPKKIATDV
jgi:uncharacterized membrane protein